MMLGLVTVGLFLFFGLSFLESNRPLAWLFMALATFRLVVWLRVAGRLLANRADKHSSTQLRERGATKPPSPEELLAAEDARAQAAGDSMQGDEASPRDSVGSGHQP